MVRRAATTAMILLVSTCLLPEASIAMDGIKSFEIGHLGDKVGATIEISSSEGRASAVPLVRVKEDPERTDAAASDGADIGKKTLAKIVPDGDISLSRGLKILDQVKEAIKKWKTEKTETRIVALPDVPSSRAEAKASEAPHAADDAADSGSQTIKLCDNCNYRLVTNTSIH